MNGWIAADLAFCIILSSCIITYALWTLQHIKIRLNLITKCKWAIALLAILMRTALSIEQFVKR